MAASAEKTDRKDAAGFALGILLWAAVWFALARAVGNDLLLAGPAETAATFVRNLADPAFWSAVGATTARILATAALAAVAGALLGAAGHRFPLARQLLAPLLQVMKSAPVACVIVVVLVTWGSAGALAVIVAFVAFPPFYVNMEAALEERPRRTEQVLRAAGVAPWRVFAACAWPAACPFFTAASKTAVALSWRAGITAELLCLPMGTIGSAVYASKLTLDSGQILTWTIVVMLLSWATEKAVVGLLRLSARSSRLALAGLPRAGAEAREAAAGDALELAGAVKAYGGAAVVDGFSLRVEPGQRACLMAPTGSGKTTLLHALAGLQGLDAGTARAPQPVGLVLQEPTLVPSLTALQNVMLACAPGASTEQVRCQLNQLLPADAASQRASELSGGTKRLVEVARALLGSGRALVLDEPFAGLDAESRKRACAFILRNLRGRPLLVSTHNPEDAELLQARIAHLN